VVLSGDLKDNEPVDIKDVFMPSDTIICTVKTSGADGIIGMRWFYGDRVIYETTGKTQKNTISTYIKSNSSAILQEGQYRVEIFMVKEPLETVNFEVRIYRPTVNPTIPIPATHVAIEQPWYPEVPFAFDEIWKTGKADWKVNEVKVVLMDSTQDYFVAVVVADENLENITSMSDSEAKRLTLPIAQYAIENGYVEKARKLEIDGNQYPLDQYVFVNLINPVTHQGYRVQFTMDEIK
jgi:hypothetical protein